MYDIKLFNEIDDIDHFTIAIRQGREFNRSRAIYFIRKYSSYYDYVNAIDSRFDESGQTFEDFTNDDLYNSLILIRDEMVKHVEINGF